MTTRTAYPTFARTARPYVTITSLVAALAAGVTGCGTSQGREDRASGVGTGSPSAEIGAEATSGRFDPGYFEGQARQYGAPLEWAERAGTIVTAVEAQRATAEATRVRAAADHAEALADANRLLADALTAFEMQSAAATRLRETAETGYSALEKQIAADERAYQAQAEAKLQEAQARFEDALRRAEVLRAEADEAFARAEAEHARLIADAEAYGVNTRSTIEQLRASAGSIVARAEAEAVALRVEAASRRSTGRAEVEAIEHELAATQRWADVRHGELVREAEAVREQSASQAESVRAQADAIMNYELDERYSTAIAAAEAARAELIAEAEMLRESTTTELVAAAATFTTERQEVRSRLETDGLTYEAELARIASDARIAEARASIARSRAQEVEHDARARFIIEIAAAMGGETHDERSHAFAWAQSLADEVGSSSGTFDAASLTVDDPGVIEAIHALVTQLAEAEALRTSAEFVLERSQSSTIMRRSEIEVWWTESRAAAEAALEGIGHSERETVARMQQQLADADEFAARADMVYEQEMLTAEAERTDAQARLENLLRREELALENGRSREQTLLAEAAATREEGFESVARLTRMRDAASSETEAAAAEIEAQVGRMLADAGVEAERFTAMALAAEQSLAPELESLSARATRLITEAAVDRDEAMRVAEGVIAMAEAAKAQTVAAIEAESTINATDLEARLVEARVARDQELAAAAATLAQATASYSSFQADDGARRAEAEAVERSLLAFVDEQHAVADAQDAAVFADFSTRLAILQADRDREYADAYFKEFLAQAGLTTADLRQYVDAADSALARLRDASTAIAAQRTATVETSPAPAEGGGGVEVLRVESISANGVASVPTADDE